MTTTDKTFKAISEAVDAGDSLFRYFLDRGDFPPTIEDLHEWRREDERSKAEKKRQDCE